MLSRNVTPPRLMYTSPSALWTNPIRRRKLAREATTSDDLEVNTAIPS